MPKGIYKHQSQQLFQKGNTYEFQKGHKINLGRKQTEVTKEKIRQNTLKQFESGMPEKTKQKIRKTNKSLGRKPPIFKGEKSSNWQGGISFLPYPTDWKEDLRDSIRKRENYMCFLCGIHQDKLTSWHKKLDVHHTEYDKNDLSPDKLVALCHSCHMKTNGNRKYWIKYFAEEKIKKIILEKIYGRRENKN